MTGTQNYNVMKNVCAPNWNRYIRIANQCYWRSTARCRLLSLRCATEEENIGEIEHTDVTVTLRTSIREQFYSNLGQEIRYFELGVPWLS
jgi:hypothetical protein